MGNILAVIAPAYIMIAMEKGNITLFGAYWGGGMSESLLMGETHGKCESTAHSFQMLVNGGTLCDPLYCQGASCDRRIVG